MRSDQTSPLAIQPKTRTMTQAPTSKVTNAEDGGKTRAQTHTPESLEVFSQPSLGTREPR